MSTISPFTSLLILISRRRRKRQCLYNTTSRLIYTTRARFGLPNLLTITKVGLSSSTPTASSPLLLLGAKNLQRNVTLLLPGILPDFEKQYKNWSNRSDKDSSHISEAGRPAGRPSSGTRGVNAATGSNAAFHALNLAGPLTATSSLQHWEKVASLRNAKVDDRTRKCLLLTKVTH